MFKIHNTKDIKAELPNFFLNDILPIQENEITLLTAKGGSGKSYLALLILMLLKKHHNLKVFGYFSEDKIGITKHRFDKLNDIHNINLDIDIIGKEARPKPFICYTRNNLASTVFFDDFKKLMQPYDVILLDPLISFIAEDENSNTEARFFMNLLNEWIEKENKTLIIIHHHNKGEDGGTVRGASSFIDSVRLHYVVTKKEDNNNDRFIKLEKVNHFQGAREYKMQVFERKVCEVVYETIDTKELEKLGIKIEDSTTDKNKIDKLSTKGFKFE